MLPSDRFSFSIFPFAAFRCHIILQTIRYCECPVADTSNWLFAGHIHRANRAWERTSSHSGRHSHGAECESVSVSVFFSQITGQRSHRWNIFRFESNDSALHRSSFSGDFSHRLVRPEM